MNNPTLANQNSNLSQTEFKEILTRKEVAELLSIDLSTLWSWTKTGKLKAYGIGNRVFYKYSEVMDSLLPINQ